MKIYQPSEPPYLMRINIKRAGDKTEHLTICDTTQQECFDFVRKLIEGQRLSVFLEGKRTNIEIREAIGSENGKAISMSFRGLSPEKVKLLIEDCIKDAR